MMPIGACPIASMNRRASHRRALAASRYRSEQVTLESGIKATLEYKDNWVSNVVIGGQSYSIRGQSKGYPGYESSVLINYDGRLKTIRYK